MRWNRKTQTVAALAAFVLVLLTLPRAINVWNSKSANPLAGATVVLDPGHGGLDAGCSAGDILESELALTLALKTGALLEKAGATVVYTRTDAEGVKDPGKKWNKQADMKGRARIINETGPGAVISFHCNTFPTPQTGAQVFLQEGASQASKDLAEAVQKTIREQMSPQNTRQTKAGDFYVLRQTTAPGILIECGFLNNPVEAALLCDASWQDTFALAVVSGVTEFFAGYLEFDAAMAPQQCECENCKCNEGQATPQEDEDEAMAFPLCPCPCKPCPCRPCPPTKTPLYCPPTKTPLYCPTPTPKPTPEVIVPTPSPTPTASPYYEDFK